MKKAKNIWSIQKKALPLHPLSEKDARFGTLPERLGIGLQNRGRRFESARYLQKPLEKAAFLFNQHPAIPVSVQ